MGWEILFAAEAVAQDVRRMLRVSSRFIPHCREFLQQLFRAWQMEDENLNFPYESNSYE